MHIHFIAIGGAIMHSLAIALHKKGYTISGSDDEIFEPAKSNLLSNNLLPLKYGWYPGKITSEINVVILGMHAQTNNPELLKAKKLGIKIYSYPEYIYEQSKDKKRIVIAGSHGKTTITAMILHVLQFCNKACDYLIGAKIKGFQTIISLTNHTSLIVLEGDEYLSSPIDKRPKFHYYQPHIALISGIAWDHINVFRTPEVYIKQFEIFINTLSNDAILIYNKSDKTLANLVQTNSSIEKIGYQRPEYIIQNNTTYLVSDDKKIQLRIFGKHNLENLSGAKTICNQLGITDKYFYKAIQSFEGAAKRLEIVGYNESTTVFNDFAHAPSKLKATINAVKNQYPERELLVCFELHTFSSLNTIFLAEYKNCMKDADIAAIYINPNNLASKKGSTISEKDLIKSFNRNDLIVYFNIEELSQYLRSQDWKNKNLLLMSSGNFGNLDLKELTTFVIK